MADSIQNGWLVDANIVPSPNYDERPNSISIDLLVVHNISLPPGQYGGKNIQQFFCNTLDCSTHPYFGEIKDLRVSSHCLIERDGCVVQFVGFNHRAWHAGKSEFQGRSRCNDFSIGIELEGTDEDQYTDAQYISLSATAKAIMEYYPEIQKDRIVGHSDIAPMRKTDPGPAFDWQRLLQKL